jgi:hypothetical protein
MKRPALAWMTVATAVAAFAPLHHCSTSGSCTISASNYDQSCAQDTDCIAAFSGSFCGGHACACENSAINASAQAQYEADLQNAHAPKCPCPAPPPVACNQGTCGLRTSGPADGGPGG